MMLPRAALVLPYLAFLAVIFVAPMGLIVTFSIHDDAGVTLRHYRRLFTEPVYWSLLANTASVSGFVTLASLVLGFPLALTIASLSERWRSVALAVVLVPFWTSVLVRTYAWLVLLQQNGVINQVLRRAGLIDAPVTLVHNLPGVVLGMTYVLLPFMVLSTYAAIGRIDSALPIAAATLGASRRTIFWRVLVPLSRSGIAAGCLVVFTLSFGFFITPALLGGLNETMAAMVIEAQMNRLLDWGFGAALSVVLMVVALSLGMAALRLIEARRLAPAARPEA